MLIKMSRILPYTWDIIWAKVYKRKMRYCGKGVYMRPMKSDYKGLDNLSVGDGSSIPKGATIYCTEAPLTIGKNVIFGPNPTIITGDHRVDVPCIYISESNEKKKENDRPVIIEDDVWCGANVIILKGVTIGKGAIVAAGSVVTRDIPPCEVWGGNPARFIKNRFSTTNEKEQHLFFLNSANN